MILLQLDFASMLKLNRSTLQLVRRFGRHLDSLVSSLLISFFVSLDSQALKVLYDTDLSSIQVPIQLALTARREGKS